MQKHCIPLASVKLALRTTYAAQSDCHVKSYATTPMLTNNYKHKAQICGEKNITDRDKCPMPTTGLHKTL